MTPSTDTSTALHAARARRLEALHGVVAAATLYAYTHAPLTGYGGPELEAALREEAKAANAITAIIRKQARHEAQPRLPSEGGTP